ncbi:MAG: glycosyltransferase family 2 protein [Salibacteraceae bacterium]|nr:glycosyltransferase family 2 protein [Salibacteraceae bacterium]|tara:strand:- start:1020 stop:2042 length:1023 start_codon:yes stop_codon:yes gene_type:complete
MINSNPLVSIIMAAKDTAPYLRECLDSVLAQTYSNWELIAVNDHSSDETPVILAEYAAKDDRIIYADGEGFKLIPTLQTAYALSSGALINRMDSDDKMPNYKIEVLVTEWLKYGKGNVIAGGTEHFVDAGAGEVGNGFLRYEKWLNNVAKHNLHYEEIYRECVIPSHCWIIHRDDFDAIDGFNPMIYPEDYDLCFRMYGQKLNIVGIDVILHHWRDRSNRISRTWDEYKDNRYYNLKVKNFNTIDNDTSRELVIWGAGKNGKDLVKLFQESQTKLNWVCDNDRKLGKDIYGIIMQSSGHILELHNPQIIIAVSSPTDKLEIKAQLKLWGKEPRKDYWFFN